VVIVILTTVGHPGEQRVLQHQPRPQHLGIISPHCSDCSGATGPILFPR
jgi:hypothetical protein